MKPRVLTKSEHNTIMAALRLFQRERYNLRNDHQDYIDSANGAIWDIATDGDIEPLTVEQIDQFCEVLNTSPLSIYED